MRYSGQVSTGAFSSSFVEWFMELMGAVTVQTVRQGGLVASPSGATEEITANNWRAGSENPAFVSPPFQPLEEREPACFS